MLNEKNVGMRADLWHDVPDSENHHHLGFHINPNDRGEKIAVFRVLSPAAKRVFLVGDFNDWQEENEAIPCGEGIFEARIEASKLYSGQNYKFKTETKNGKILFKSDPYALGKEDGEGCASQIPVFTPYVWHDDGYLSFRRKLFAVNGKDIPINAYRMTLHGWCGNSKKTYGEIADEVVPYLKQMGYTHLQLELEAGSFCPPARYGNAHELKLFSDKLHSAGIGFIVEWDISILDESEYGLCTFDGTELFEVNRNARKHFDFSKKHVCDLLKSSAIHLIKEFHLDGLFINAKDLFEDGDILEKQVCDLFKDLNLKIALSHPDVFTVASENVIDRDGTGYVFALDKKFENSILYRNSDIFRTAKGKMYCVSDNNAFSQDLSLSKLALSCMVLLPSKKMTLMGNEIGKACKKGERILFDILGNGAHKSHQLFVRDLNKIYLSFPVLWQDEGNVSVQIHSQNVVSFVRINKKGGTYKELTVLLNFGYDDAKDISVNTSKAKTVRKILSSEPSEEKMFKTNIDADGNFYFTTLSPAMSVSIFEACEDNEDIFFQNTTTTI